MSMTLEQQCANMADTHGLDALSLHFGKASDGRPMYYAYAHRDGKCASCGVDDYDSFAAALVAAIAGLNEVSVPKLAPMEVQAA